MLRHAGRVASTHSARLQALAEVGQVRHEALSVGTAVVPPVDVQDVVALIPQFPDDLPSGLATASRDDESHLGTPSSSV